MPEDRNPELTEKPQYEPPLAVALTELDHGLGQCATGTGDDGCFPGIGADQCTAGTSANFG